MTETLTPNRPETDEPPAVLGKPAPHDSALRHATGSALYIDDLPEPEGCLHLAPGMAPAAKGTIRALDLSAVRAHPGVVAVLTARDVPGANDCSPVAFDIDPVIADGQIAFHGQVAFLVVAETRLAARRAARLARFDIAAQAPIVDVDAALARGKTLLPDYAFGRGDVRSALAGSEKRVGATFRVGGQEHFYLEGQVALAIPSEGGDMLVLSSTQHPSEVQHVVARVLGLPDAAVTCEVRRMGGGFGGKESQASQWAALAALAARHTGRACKLRLDRDDDFVLTGKRHDFRLDIEAGFSRDGTLSGADLTLSARCGHSADLSSGVCDRAMFHADNAYFLPACRIRSRRMKTDTVSNTAFRGFGGPQGMVAAERMMDLIAWTAGLDPLDVRKRNLYRPGADVTPYGQRIEDDTAPALIEALEASSDYRARRAGIAAFNATSSVLKRGIALTPVKFGISFTLAHLNQAGALVHVYSDGSVHLNHGGTEMGQGLNVKVAQVVAEEFGLPLEAVKITATTTGKVPNTAPTAASAGSDLNGMAAREAARAIKGRLIDFLAEGHGVERGQIRFRDGRVIVGNEALAFKEVAKAAVLARVQLSATGFYRTPKIHWDRAKGEGRPFLYFAYGAACSEVAIDTLTGEMRLLRVDILHDVGRSLNPAVDIGQIEGGFVQGLGWLTTEELVFDTEGRLKTHAPSTYKIPVASDVPADFRVALWDGENREDTIFRSKAVGEPPIMLAISAWCAIADAIHSLRPGRAVSLDAPATPEAILRAVATARGETL